MGVNTDLNPSEEPRIILDLSMLQKTMLQEKIKWIQEIKAKVNSKYGLSTCSITKEVEQ